MERLPWAPLAAPVFGNRFRGPRNEPEAAQPCDFQIGFVWLCFGFVWVRFGLSFLRFAMPACTQWGSFGKKGFYFSTPLPALVSFEEERGALAQPLQPFQLGHGAEHLALKPPFVAHHPFQHLQGRPDRGSLTRSLFILVP